MASNLVIVSETGKVYHVTLGDPSQSVELKPDDPTAVAARQKAAEGVLIAELDPAVEQKSAGSGEVAAIIMGTFVNLSLIGDGGGSSKY